MSGPRHLRYEKAKASAPYRALVDAAMERLTTVGYFSKDAILDDTGFAVLGEEAIHWEHLVTMIEEQGTTELIKMAESFFRRHDASMPATLFPTKYIALGHGKKTAGYCIASQENSHYVVSVLNLKEAQALGKVKARNKTLSIAETAHVDGLNGRTQGRVEYEPPPAPAEQPGLIALAAPEDSVAC